MSNVISLEEFKMERETLAGRVDRALADLPVIEQHVIVNLFSLDGAGTESASEIAQKLRTSPEVIEEVAAEALRKLRRVKSKFPEFQRIVA